MGTNEKVALLRLRNNLQHDGTALALMYAMGVGNDLMIPYASALIMEIYKDGNDHTVEVS